jgi:hypothetical protein
MDCPEHRRRTIRFALTNISISYNVEMTVRTTNVNVFTRTAQEGTSTSFYRAQVSALLLYISVGLRQLTFLFHGLVWGRLLALIIRKNDAMSRPTRKLWSLIMGLYPENMFFNNEVVS